MALPVSRGTAITLAVVAVAIVAVVSGFIGWSVRAQTSHPVSVQNFGTGHVAFLDADGTAGCVQSTSGRLCSRLAVVGGERLRVGEAVAVAREWYKNSSGDGYDLLLVLTTPPGK